MTTNNPHSQGHLTEQEVAKYFFPYLQEFYRYRYEYRPDTYEAHSEQVTTDGLKADGILRFQKADGTPFVAAFEATGQEVIDEVKFRVNTAFFIWDCTAFSALMTALGYALFFLFSPIFLKKLQWIGNFGLIAFSLIFFFSLWYFAFQKWKRYRYIYAVEQFKHYYADEQWIAIAEDVFLSEQNPYKIELKAQCMYNGFGLVEVKKDGTIRPIATPSRLGMYGRDRRLRSWVKSTEFFKGFSDIRRVEKGLPQGLMKYVALAWRPIDYMVVKPLKNLIWNIVGKPFSSSEGVFGRYMKTENYQKWLTIGSFCFLALLAWKNMGPGVKTEVSTEQLLTDFWGQKEVYETKKGEKYIANAEYETDKIRIDEDGVPWYRRGMARQYPYWEEAEEKTPLQPQIASASPIPQVQKPKPKAPKRKPQNLKPQTPVYADASLTRAKSAKPVTYYAPKLPDPCAAFANKEGWLVQDNFYIDRANAEGRVAHLKKYNIQANYTAAACIHPQKSGYYVFIGNLFTDKKAAESALKDHKSKLNRTGLPQAKPFIRSVGFCE